MTSQENPTGRLSISDDEMPPKKTMTLQVDGVLSFWLERYCKETQQTRTRVVREALYAYAYSKGSGPLR